MAPRETVMASRVDDDRPLATGPPLVLYVCAPCRRGSPRRAAVSPVDTPRVLVTVGHPTIAWGEGQQDRAEVREALVLTCSEHGELTDWLSIPERHLLQRRARRHAGEHHDGDVDAEGWAR